GVEIVDGARVEAVETLAGAARIEYVRGEASFSALGEVVALADGGVGGDRPGRTTALDYGQCALVAMLTASRAQPDWAYERFTGEGPIALLPFAGGHALIWTVPQEKAAALLALDDDAFAVALTETYGERLGTVTLASARACFPLQLRFAHRIAGSRQVLIGNAAQTLHPVAGQGF